MALGAGGAGFPDTRWSAIEGLRSGDAAERDRSFDVLVAAYWKPVYKYVRFRYRRQPDDAADSTQAFFLKALEKSWFAPFDPAKGRFRTFLRACLDAFLSNESRAAGRLKRGGEAELIPLDFDGAERELERAGAGGGGSPEEYFEQEWIRSLFGLAVDSLRRECQASGREAIFRVFERYDLEERGAARPTYDQVASEVGLPVTTVTNHLHAARRAFRRIVLERLREITATDDEFRREARLLLGAEEP